MVLVGNEDQEEAQEQWFTYKRTCLYEQKLADKLENRC